MSKQIALTQYAEDGAVVHVIVATGESTQAVDEHGSPLFKDAEDSLDPLPVMVPVTEQHTFGRMPEFTDATSKTRFTVAMYVAQCEAEVQSILDADSAQPRLVEVKR